MTLVKAAISDGTRQRREGARARLLAKIVGELEMLTHGEFLQPARV